MMAKRSWPQSYSRLEWSRFLVCVLSCPSSLLIQREWYRWWPYEERRDPGRRARALCRDHTIQWAAELDNAIAEGSQQSTRSD